jgi:hypothetical protein
MVSKYTLKKEAVKAYSPAFVRWCQGYEIYDRFSMVLYIILNSFFSFYMIRYYFDNGGLSNILKGAFLGIASFTWLFMAQRWGLEAADYSIRDKQFSHIVSQELTKIIIASLLSSVIYLNMKLNSDRFFNTNSFLIVLAVALNIRKFLELADMFTFRHPDKSRHGDIKSLINDIYEQIIDEPIQGAKALSEYLQGKKEWEDKKNEVHLMRSELESIQKEIDLYGQDSTAKVDRRRVIHNLLRICSELERANNKENLI